MGAWILMLELRWLQEPGGLQYSKSLKKDVVRKSTRVLQYREWNNPERKGAEPQWRDVPVVNSEK